MITVTLPDWFVYLLAFLAVLQAISISLEAVLSVYRSRLTKRLAEDLNTIEKSKKNKQC